MLSKDNNKKLIFIGLVLGIVGTVLVARPFFVKEVQVSIPVPVNLPPLSYTTAEAERDFLLKFRVLLDDTVIQFLDSAGRKLTEEDLNCSLENIAIMRVLTPNGSSFSFQIIDQKNVFPIIRKLYSGRVQVK